MPALNNLVGKRFGKLLVVALSPERTPRGGTRWICKCDCGGEATVRTVNLGRNTNSCGCAHYSQGRLTRKHPLWAKWSGMIARCTQPGSFMYYKYGGRGVMVADRWKHFPHFLEDMEASYFLGATLDRYPICDGNYGPENTRWATAKQQTRNRRCSIMIDTPWGRMNVAEAAERIGMPRERFSTRVKLGWTMEQLFDPRNSQPLTKWDRRKGKRAAA